MPAGQRITRKRDCVAPTGAEGTRCGSGLRRTGKRGLCHAGAVTAGQGAFIAGRSAHSSMAELPAKRPLDEPAKKSVVQISKTRQLEKMKDLEGRVASLRRARDVLLVKNRMVKHLLAVKAQTLQRGGSQVPAFLKLENARLSTALEDLKNGTPDAATLCRATSLLGPSFAVHDHLADVNALFADAADRFHDDRCEDI